MEPSHDDGLKWFGEGFDGFPKRLPDNTIEYSIFVIGNKLSSAASVRARLAAILKDATQHTKAILQDFIWQHDRFALQIKDKDSNAGVLRDDAQAIAQLHLAGRVNFGDSVSDEWLVVYILLELSKRHPDIWIKATDTDGEFLLIEAANALPKWLNPDVADNRVWLSNGHLRLIPLEAGESQGSLPLHEALSIITHHKDRTIVSPSVEDAALARLKDYPAAIEGSLHHALVTIPRNLAYILQQDEAYIAPAIDAFYLRDAVALRPLATKDLATLQFPPEDLVTVSTKFTKVGYAQLRGQVFDPPPSWIGLRPKMREEKAQIGMKLTCGFEMLLADPVNKDKKEVREIQLLLEDISSGEAELPSNEDIAKQQRQDDEKWLEIDYDDFEAELSGKSKEMDTDEGTAQDNLRKMVSRFQDFVAADSEDELESDDESASSSGEDKDGSYDEAEFEQAMKEMMGMSEQAKQDAGLMDEARKLAIADGDMAEDEEDEEIKKMMELIEEELKDAGALRRKAGRSKTASTAAKKVVVFGPEVPPDFRRQEEADVESADEEIGPGDEDIEPGDLELSSDDEDFNDIDLNLAQNLLSSFKGQAGASGPAGNMMRALGLNMPRDEGED